MPHKGGHTLGGLLKGFLSEADTGESKDLDLGFSDARASDNDIPATDNTIPGFGMGGGDMRMPRPAPKRARMSDRITENRESHFDRESARFHDPDTGRFEPGSPPPDLDQETNRYRAKDGRFKARSNDLFDEPEEVATDSLDLLG